MSDSIAHFRIPTHIDFGWGALKKLPAILKKAHLKRPLIVSDQTVVKLPLFKSVVKVLRDENLASVVYSDAEGNPIESQVSAGVMKYKECRADSLILLGGGCALDVGKAIALMVYHPGKLFDYEDGKIDAKEFNREIPYMLAIPTTAGTGSEVGGSAVISSDVDHKKVIIWSERLVPNWVIADPELTVGLPAKVTAATGLDALTHNIEAFLAKNTHPICDGIALEGLYLVHKYLRLAYREPDNKEARTGMLAASMMGATAFQKGLGVTHSCAHALSTCFDLHHGLANALMLPACLRFNAEVSARKFQRMAQTIGLSFNSESEAVSAFIGWCEDLIKDVGLCLSLKSFGVSLTEQLLETAWQDSCHSNNPRVCKQEDFALLFERCL